MPKTKTKKSQIETESPLVKTKDDIIDPPKYSDDEEIYIRGLRKKLEHARNSRDTTHREFDGMDYITKDQLEEELANSELRPKKNKEDTNFISGTIRTKLFYLLASITSLDLTGDIIAFDKNGLKIQALGDAMEDIVLKTNELDQDKEKKQIRQYELLKHGTVFVEEIWDARSQKDKKMQGEFTGKLDLKWETRIKKAFARPSRNVIPGINVYLGDITKYNISDQPFIFTVDVMPWSEAELIFGEWERWKNVPKKIVYDKLTISLRNWTLLQVQENYVEIIRYQDKWNNEFAVKINGVLMTPMGLPMPWGYLEYNITQQNLEPIHSKFAYGKSLVFRIRNKVALLDEMMRLAILKTQKSFMPPYVNITGRVLSNRVLMPGKISHGFQPNQLVPINDKEAQGLTSSELSMITELKQSIDQEDTPKPAMTPGRPTVAQILEYQREAKLLIGLTIFSVSMLEWKLEWLRLQNLLKNWFSPEDTELDEARQELRNKYRAVSVNRPIEGQGMGIRMVIPTKKIPSPYATMQAEDILSKEQQTPIRLIFLDPDEIKSSKICWQIVVIPKEQRTSETEKLLFRAEMADAIPLQPDMEYVREKFATVWGENPKKMFSQPFNATPPGANLGEENPSGENGIEGAGAPPSPNKVLGPGVRLPISKVASK